MLQKSDRLQWLCFMEKISMKLQERMCPIINIYHMMRTINLPKSVRWTITSACLYCQKYVIVTLQYMRFKTLVDIMNSKIIKVQRLSISMLMNSFKIKIWLLITRFARYITLNNLKWSNIFTLQIVYS